MSGKIKLLPDNVANQIAAGEVVTRPASVVKEMMENAVDADSKNVTVIFRDGGREFIQVIDDGEGMSPADARLAFDKHATSKITSLDDVYRLHTFGFRGEALASIAAVASVELVTRREEDELGVKVSIDGGHFKEQEMIVAAKGSRFSVKNIFFNVPARRRQLDKSTSETRCIVSEFQKVALCHPEVAFALYNGDAPLYDLPVASLKQRIVGIIGRNMSNNLLEVSTDTTIASIEGFVGTPSSAKKTGEQFMFVNGRYFKSPYLHKAILQAYDKLIPNNVQPSYFIYIKVDPENLDVNIHPQKTEVRFEDGPAVWQILNASVRESLAKMGAVPLMDFDDKGDIDIPVFESARRVETGIRTPSSSLNPLYNPFNEKQVFEEKKLKSVNFDAIEPYSVGKDIHDDDSIFDFIEGREDDAFQGSLDMDMESETYIVPIAGGYIVTSIDGRLAIVDLKRAREAILYRRYLTMLEGDNYVSQMLIFPERLVFSHDDVMLLQENYDDFTSFGFDYNIIDDNTVDVIALPAELQQGCISEVLYDMIDGIRGETYDAEKLRREHMAEVLSFWSGYGRFNESELKAIVEMLKSNKDYAYTADGRSVVEFIDSQEIKKRFEK